MEGDLSNIVPAGAESGLVRPALGDFDVMKTYLTTSKSRPHITPPDKKVWTIMRMPPRGGRRRWRHRASRRDPPSSRRHSRIFQALRRRRQSIRFELMRGPVRDAPAIHIPAVLPIDNLPTKITAIEEAHFMGCELRIEKASGVNNVVAVVTGQVLRVPYSKVRCSSHCNPPCI